MTEREYLVALYSFVSYGPARTRLLLSYFGSAKSAWTASKSKLLEIGLGNKITESFLVYRDKFDFNGYFSLLKRLSIGFVTFTDGNYPENLRDLDDAPIVLYVKGDVNFGNNAVSVIGSRKMTSYGKEVAEMFSTELASLGVVIVSGLARGIDTVAHKSALTVGGRTVAVLGCGLDMVYPPENKSLAREIVDKGGAVLSEYPIGYPALRNNFAQRNRIVSGLSRAIIVVEGYKKSGTLLTASHAASQGKTVFAVPGQITSLASEACFFLIKNGAKMATSPTDVLEELNIQFKVDRAEVEKVMPHDAKEAQILQVLESEERHLDEIVRISSLKIADVSAKLMVMELKGMVRNLGEGVYRKA